MKKSDRNSLIALPVVVVIAALVALAGSQGGSTVGGLPVFALCVLLAFVIQWVAFIPAYLLQTERFFDITGSLTYITVMVVAVLLAGRAGRPLLAAARHGGRSGPRASARICSCASARPGRTSASPRSSRPSRAFSTRGPCRASGSR